MIKVVFLRHGESVWNKENRFTGWTDVDLTPRGVKEAERSAKELVKAGFVFDEAHTSFLLRASRTLEIVLKKMGLSIPVEQTWRLNERHYGALQGLNKSETAEKYGEEQVLKWRRSWDIPPPTLGELDERWPGHDPRYQDIPDKAARPFAESLKECTARVVPYWRDTLIPRLRRGQRLLIVASGNSLRGIVKHLDGISNEEIPKLNIPTGVPLVYELDEKNDFKPIKHYYLGDQKAIEKQIAEVKNQAMRK